MGYFRDVLGILFICIVDILRQIIKFLLLDHLLRYGLRPFVSNLYEVISLDINYFFQYGHEVEYKAIHKRIAKKKDDLSYIKGDIIQVPISTTSQHVPLHTGTNLRTNETGHFARSSVQKKFLVSNTYPLFLS